METTSFEEFEKALFEVEEQPSVEISEPIHDVFEIRNVYQAICYLDHANLCKDLIEEYQSAKPGSYSSKVLEYRIIVAALTNNERRRLTTGKKWFPIVQFCKPGKEWICRGDTVVGKIKSEGKTYSVISGYAYYGGYVGLGSFGSDYTVSYTDGYVGFRSVSSKKVAKYISTYFGRLLFEITYLGTNCDWEWIK